MKRVFSYQLSLIVCLSFMTASLYPRASFAESCEQWIAKAVSVQGSVEARRSGETQWQPVKLNDTYCPGDKIRVNERSRAGLSLVNQPLLRLDQNTTITLGGMKEKQTSVVTLARGAVHFFSRIRRNLEVVTGFVNAGVEGTEGLIRVEQDRTLITIFDGQVLASNAVWKPHAHQRSIGSGRGRQSACAAGCGAPPGCRPLGTCTICRSCIVQPGKAPKEDMGDPRFLAYRASQPAGCRPRG